MTVSNDTIIESDGGTQPRVYIRNNGDLSTEDLRLYGGEINLDGGNLLVSDFVEITSYDSDGNHVGDGEIFGHGLVLVDGSLRNNGRIYASGGTLRFTSGSSDPTPWNLDGSTTSAGLQDGDGKVYAVYGDIEFENGGLNDEFDGIMTVGHVSNGSRRYISFAEAWTLGDDGQLTLQGDNANTYSTRAEIIGNGALTVRGDLSARNYARIDTMVTFAAGSDISIQEDSSLRVAKDNLIVYEGGDFNGKGTFYSNSDGYVQSYSTVDFGVDRIDLDGVYENSAFTMMAGSVANFTGEGLTDAYSGTLTMYDDSVLNINMTDEWYVMDMNGNVISTHTINKPFVVDGELNFVSADGAAVAGSSQLQIEGTARVDSGWAQISSDVWFKDGSTLRVDGGEQLTINGGSKFNTGSTQNIYGTLQVLGDTTYEGNTTIGTFGKVEVWQPWEMAGTMDITTRHIGGSTAIEGADVEISGTLNVDGIATVDAKVDVSGSVHFVDTDAELALGRGSHADPNRISGGTIDGWGVLASSGDNSLHGYGTIDAYVEFADQANLIAEGGTLHVDRNIRDAHYVGTAGAGDILDLGVSFSTGNVGKLILNDGEVTGASITNGGVTEGYGLITSSSFNNKGTVSAIGGLLEVAPSSPLDMDGTNENGVWNAIDGDLKVHPGTSLVRFNGTINIGDGRQFTQWGGYLSNEGGANPGEINFTGGELQVSKFYQSGNLTTSGAAATLDSRSVFEASGVNTLGSDLHIEGSGEVLAGATFSGAGALVNDSGSTLYLRDGADIGVEVDNHGTLVIGSSPGSVAVEALTLEASSLLEIEIGGMTPGTEYDQVNVDGELAVDGDLDVLLISGFSPDDGSIFDIFSFTTISGTFASINLPTLASGLRWDTSELYTDGLLSVTALSASDIDGDGDTDGADLSYFFSAFSGPGGSTSNPMTDLDGDGDTDGADLSMAFAEFTGPSSPAAVPEPGALSLLAFGLGLIARRRRA